MEIKKYRIIGMTCGSCAMGIEKTIQSIEEVNSASVDFRKSELTIHSDNAIEISKLQDSVKKLGNYTIENQNEAKKSKTQNMESAWWWGFSGILLIAILFYLVQALGMQSFRAPIEFMLDQWYLVLPLILGFGIQAGLFRAIHILTNHGGGAAMATSGGVSTGTMLACCMHNLVLLLPILGVSGLVAFFAAYQTQVFIFSILVVAIGTGYMFKKYQSIKNHKKLSNN